MQDFKAIDIKKPDNHRALCAAVEFILRYRDKQGITKFTLWFQFFFCHIWSEASPWGPGTGWSSPPTTWTSDCTWPWPGCHGMTPPARNWAHWPSVNAERTELKSQSAKGNIYFYFFKVHEQGGRVTSSPLAVSFLCVSASPRAQPSTASSCKTTTHLFSAEPPRKIGRIFEHQAILAGLFWPLLDCLSEALWWYKFLLPRLRQTERFPDGGRRRWYSVNSEVGHRGNSEHFLEKTSAVLAFRGTYRE